MSKYLTNKIDQDWKDLEIYHDGNTYIENEVGDFQIFKSTMTKDIVLSSDDDSNGTIIT